MSLDNIYGAWFIVTNGRQRNATTYKNGESKIIWIMMATVCHVTSSSDLENFRPLDLCRTKCTSATIWLHTTHGSNCNLKYHKPLLPKALYYHYRPVYLYKIFDRIPCLKVTKNHISFATRQRDITQSCV
jgi:hypothetical protein